MEGTQKQFKLYKRRWAVLLSFVCVNAVMQYGWAFFSAIVTDAWKFYGFQDAATGEAAISALTMIIMVAMITLSIPASWVFEKIGWYKTVSIAGIVLMIFTLLRGFIGGTSYTALVITTIGIAVTQPFIINAFGIISAKWFPPSERGVANGLGYDFYLLGRCDGTVRCALAHEHFWYGYPWRTEGIWLPVHPHDPVVRDRFQRSASYASCQRRTRRARQLC